MFVSKKLRELGDLWGGFFPALSCRQAGSQVFQAIRTWMRRSSQITINWLLAASGILIISLKTARPILDSKPNLKTHPNQQNATAVFAAGKLETKIRQEKAYQDRQTEYLSNKALESFITHSSAHHMWKGNVLDLRDAEEGVLVTAAHIIFANQHSNDPLLKEIGKDQYIACGRLLKALDRIESPLPSEEVTLMGPFMENGKTGYHAA